jgi:hypothetical protein
MRYLTKVSPKVVTSGITNGCLMSFDINVKGIIFLWLLYFRNMIRSDLVWFVTGMSSAAASDKL